MTKKLAILLLLAFSVTASVSPSHAQTADTVWHLVNGSLPPNLTSMTWTTLDTGFFLTQQSDKFLTTTLNGGISFGTSKFPDSIVMVNGGISHYRDFENITGGMSWATPATGYIAGKTGGDSLAARPTILKTTNAGTTWREYYAADTTASFTNIDFPRERVGYATADLDDLSIEIMRSTDSGKTWDSIFHSDTLSFPQTSPRILDFFDANNGIIFAQGPVSNHILYTTDQGASFHLAPIPSGSLLTFLRWNQDSSWLIAIDSSIYRSLDSGQHWTTVVAADTNGTIATMTMNDSMGFAFRTALADTLPNIALSTRDYGAHWKSNTLPRITSNFLVPQSASMPSDSVGYLMALDGGSFDLLQIVIHSPGYYIQGGGGNGVSLAPTETSAFSASTNGNEIVFNAASAQGTRTIEIIDILGRACASLSLPPGANMSALPMNELRAGGYFARLGNQVVKFSIWN